MRLGSALVPFLLVAVVAGTAHATTRHVPAEYPSIQSALDASTVGDLVLVAPGTYFENLFMGSQHNGVALVSEGGAAVTTIDGGHLNRVLRATSVGPQTRIEGFTLANGRAEPFTPNNIGGGIRLDHADLAIVRNVIRDNFAEGAGGLYVNYSSPTLVDNVIRDNEALGSGGAIYCDHYGSALIERNVIHGNRCGHYGGGITIWQGATPLVRSNTIVANVATLGGGGIYVTTNSRPEIARNIVALHAAGNGIMRGDQESTLVLSCNDLWENAPANYAGWLDPTGTDGNIALDPLFCDSGSFDFRIADVSPCAPDHSPEGCALIGALDVGCGPTAIEAASWGLIKTRYLLPGSGK